MTDKPPVQWEFMGSGIQKAVINGADYFVVSFAGARYSVGRGVDMLADFKTLEEAYAHAEKDAYSIGTSWVMSPPESGLFIPKESSVEV